MPITSHPAVQRITQALREGLPLSQFTPTDLSTLQLYLGQDAAERLTPAVLQTKYDQNVYALPGPIDALRLRELETRLLRCAVARGFEAVQLSPVSPLGACSAVATVDQSKVVSAVRNLEVTADPTNALALEACRRMRNARPSGILHLCTTHRVVRTQPVHKPGLVTHFTMLALVSAGSDQGSYGFEKQAMQAHAALYSEIFGDIFPAKPTFLLRKMKGYAEGEGLLTRLADHLRAQQPGIAVARNPQDGENNYYQGMQFHVDIAPADQTIHIGDGGFVDWSQKLLSNKKQRMLISAIGVDRLLTLFDTTC